MESVGIKLDRRKAGKMVSYILEKMVFIEGEIYKLAGERFNLDSASEVSKVDFFLLIKNIFLIIDSLYKITIKFA